MSEVTQAQYDELLEKYEKLRLSEENYRVAMGLTNHTISVVDIEGHFLEQIYNEGEWSGVSVTMPDVPESVISTGIIHPDDVEGYREFYNKIYSGVPKGEYTMRTMEETRGWVWFTMYYQTVFDKDGTPLRAICFSDDITIEKSAEEKYQQYKSAVTAEAEYVWEVNLTRDKILSGSSSTNEIFGDVEFGSFSEMSKEALQNISEPTIRQQVVSLFSRDGLLAAFNDAKREVATEYPYLSADRVRWMRANAYLMTNNVSDVTAIICVNDVTDTHERIKNLEMMAEHDALTGLYNRSSFEKRARSILENYSTQLHGFLMIDMDNFKLCNDNFGHSFGDKVLQMFARVVNEVFRGSDLVGRVGGDEFMVVMMNAGSKEIIDTKAKQLQKRFREECDAMKVPSNVTISIGAAISHMGDTYNDLYIKADNLMYRSKKAGKNSINISDNN